MKFYSLLFLFFILANSCENDYSKFCVLIRTGEVTGMDESGVWFNAVITNETNEDIIDHGFVWGITRQPLLPNNFSNSLGDLAGKKSFSSFIPASQLQTGVTIYVRAYIKTSEYVSYGPQVIFHYLTANNTPIIQVVKPIMIYESDKVKITRPFICINFGKESDPEVPEEKITC